MDLPAGDVDVNGFVIDMATVFEDFVTISLGDALARIAGRVEPQDRQTLDIGGSVDMRPDLVWYRHGAPIAVIDAKYKAEKIAGYPNADLYQLLAYCTALGLHTGHLVYAKGNEPERVHVVRGSRTQLHVHALDLELPSRGPADAGGGGGRHRGDGAAPETMGRRGNDNSDPYGRAQGPINALATNALYDSGEVSGGGATSARPRARERRRRRPAARRAAHRRPRG